MKFIQTSCHKEGRGLLARRVKKLSGCLGDPVAESSAPIAKAISSESRNWWQEEFFCKDVCTLFDQGPLEMSVNFLGIAGAQGPLPIAYTELVLQRFRIKE